MKTDRKIKTEKKTPKMKAVKRNVRAAPGLDGKQLLAAYEHIPVGIVEASLEGKYIDVNQEFCRILGYSRTELLQFGIKDCTHEDEYGIDSRLYGQLIAGKIPFYKLEKRYVRKAGGVIWVELTRSLVCDEKGKPLYTVGVVLDISDRKDVEKVLRESVERLRLATESAKMFMWEWDFRTRSYTLADNFEKVLGFSGGLLPKNSFETLWALSPKEDVRLISEAFEEAVEKQGDLHYLPYRVINPENREVVWLEINAKIIYGPEGKPERMFGVGQNITESKQTQDEIAVISRMPAENPNPVMRITPDGRLLYANPASTPLLEKWMHGSKTMLPDEVKYAVAQAFDSGVKTELEIEQRGIFYACTLAPIVEAGYVNLYAKDITERKRAEAEVTEFARQQEALYKLSDVLHRTDSLEDVYEAALDAILRALRCDRASILLFDDRGIMRFVAWRGLSDAYRKAADGHSPWKPDAKDPEPIVVENLRTAELSESLRRAVEREGIGSLAFIPLVSNGRLIGKFTAYFDTPHVFHETGLGLSLTIAHQLASGVERKRAEEKLRKSEERFRQAANASRALVYEVDLVSGASAVVHGLEDLTGYEPQEVTASSDWWHSLIHPEDLPAHLAQLDVLLQEGGTDVCEYCIRHSNGDWIFVQDNRLVISDETGIPVRLVGAVIDITGRKRVEEQLRAKEAELEEIINQTPFMLTRCTSDLRYRFVSRAYAEMIGRLPEHIAGKPIVDIMGEAGLDTISPYVEKVLQGNPVEFEIAVPLQGIGVPYLRVAYTPDRDEDGNVIGWFASIIDITERKQTEHALAREQKLLERLFETMPVMVSMYDPDMQSMRLNAEFERLIGWKSEEVTAFSLLETLYPDPDYRQQVIQHMAEAGKNEWVEVQVRTRDGRTMDSMWSNISIMEDQKLVMGIAIGIDITERKQTEKRLALLAEISEMLRNFDDPHELMYTISEAVGKHLQVKRALFNEIDLEHDREIVHRDYHNGLGSVAGIHKISDYSRITSAEVAAGKTVVNADAKTDPRTAGDYERTYALSGERSYVVVPLMRDNRWVASLWVSDDLPRRWSQEEVSFIETVAERTWTIVEKLRIDMALRASEALYRAIARGIPGGGVYVVDQDFRYLVAEGPVTEAFGLTSETLEGHTVTEVFPDERGARMEERLKRTFAGETVSFETEHQGRVYWSQQAPLLDSIGQAIILTLDITERKRAEEALRQSEERFTRFMQHLPGLAWIKDMEGRYVYANAAAENAFHTPWEKLYGRTDEDIFPPEVAAQFRRNDALALTDEKGVQVIETLKHADGIVHSSLVNKFPIPGPDRSTTLIGGTAFDITERLRAEEALRESEERFRAILRQATAGIVRKNEEGRLIFVNQAFCNMLGRTEEELLGKTMWEFMHPDDVEENRRSYDLLMMEGIPLKLERRLLRQDGSVIWVDASVSPIMDATGKPQSAVAVEVDITARKQAEEALHQLNLQLEDRVLKRTAKLRATNQALREEVAERQKAEESARANEEKLKTLFDLLPVGISFLDLEGRIIQMNPALANILKLSEEELSKQTYRSRNYIWANGRPMQPTEFASQRALTSGRTVHNLETGIVLEDGEVIWTSVSAAPVDVADVGVVVVTVDITESKRAEQALQEGRERLQILSQRLVEVQEEERRAIARELHDRVGQTLAALNINLIIMKNQLSPDSAEQIGVRLSDSMKLLAETISLVRDVMSNLRPAVLDDYGLAAAIESHLSQFTSRYLIQAKFEKPDHPFPRLGASLEMTFLRIAQEALMNVAKHAQASQVHLLLWEEENMVYMKIQDNGKGLASRQDEDRPGSHGLTIMRERAEAFGGSLSVRSVPGKGTEVQVKIPLENASSSRAENVVNS